MCAVVIIGQNYQALFDWSSFSTILSSYIGLPLFIALWVGHKLTTRSHMVSLDNVDISRHHQM